METKQSIELVPPQGWNIIVLPFSKSEKDGHSMFFLGRGNEARGDESHDFVLIQPSIKSLGSPLNFLKACEWAEGNNLARSRGEDIGAIALVVSLMWSIRESGKANAGEAKEIRVVSTHTFDAEESLRDTKFVFTTQGLRPINMVGTAWDWLVFKRSH